MAVYSGIEISFHKISGRATAPPLCHQYRHGAEHFVGVNKTLPTKSFAFLPASEKPLSTPLSSTLIFTKRSNKFTLSPHFLGDF
jgi:hypothetical protein